MSVVDRTSGNLLHEIELLRNRVAELEQSQKHYKQAEAELPDRINIANLSAEVNLTLSAKENLQQMLDHCVQAIVTHLNAAFARVWLLNPETQELVLQASAGLYTHLDGEHSRIPLGKFKIGQIAQQGKPHLTNSVIGDPNVSNQEWARREGMVAFAGYPLMVQDELRGVIAMFARNPLSGVTLNGLAAVADGLALGIDRKLAENQLLESQLRLREQTEIVETINRVGLLLSGELDLQKLVQAVTDAATELTGAQFGAFFYNLIDQHGESYTLFTISGVPRHNFSKFPMPRNTLLFGPTFTGEGIIRLEDVHLDPRYGKNYPYFGMPPGHLPVTSYLAVPVVSRSGEVLGGLFFGHSQAGVFSERAERLVAGLASQTAIAMDNARLYAQAQRAIQTRDEFLSIAAHELKTPITSIRGFGQLLARQVTKNTTLQSGDLQRTIDIIVQQSGKLNHLVGQLLDVSRLSSNRLELECQPTDLKRLIDGIVANVALTTDQHNIITNVPENILALVDPVRTEQVITNLLTNAVKYSPSGGSIWIDLSLSENEKQLRLAVTDQGLGISPEHRSHIFERFYRAHTSPSLTGVGLGLYISRQIVELHSGRIEAEFPAEGGTRFVVTLPYTRPE